MSKVVFQGKSKTGKDIVIRYPEMSDLEQLIEYINTLSREQSFIRFQGEQVTHQEEKGYLENEIDKIQKKEAVQLFAFCDEKLVGNSAIDMGNKIEKHVGSFGISIANGFRGEGIGKILMEHVISEAEAQIPQLKIITLGVFENNPVAINMYKEYGFKEYGNLPEGVLHKDQYIDHIYMYKKLR